MSINQIFEDLASDNSRNFKIDLLTKHKDNETLRRVIFLALDPFTQFYIRKIPEYRTDQVKSLVLSDALDLLSHLSERVHTGNAGIEHLTSILEQCTEPKVIERIIAKDLKCGVSNSSVNKVWKNLIPEYPCLLASGYDQKLVDNIEFPAIAQLKLDGMRFNAIVKGDSVEFRSRSGKEINIPNPLFHEIFAKLGKQYDFPMVFDGELLVADSFGKPLDRKTGNGILNKAVKNTISVAESMDIRANIWDAIPLEHFEKGVFKVAYKERFDLLSRNVKNISSSIDHYIELCPTWEVTSLYQAKQIFERELASGQEGIILKSEDMIWENKRSKKQIKFKGELECDLKVVDWVEGTGKYHGVLGALVLESSDGKVSVNVGTGFSDEDRKSITRKNSVGKIVAVKYNARISDKSGDVNSLFLPVFIEFREDKDVADSDKDIK